MKPHHVGWSKRGGLALIGLVVLVFAGVSSGVVPVDASSGHWAITEVLLHYAMERSVATQTFLRVETLDLDQEWLVLKGAGHYEYGCRPCHGAPDLPPPLVPAAMTPHPPELSSRIAEWSAEELFYIVKHGVKFTAMPGWPAQDRDDEIRAIVAFLLEMPRLDAAAYRELVYGDSTRLPVEPTSLLAGDGARAQLQLACARCHGERGEGRESAAFPRLAGQSSEYQLAALVAYASGERRSGIMQPLAAAMSSEDMRAISDLYASASPPSGNTAANDRGRLIAERGIPERGIPACIECHGPREGPRNSAYPRLEGQFADYLVLQLELFAEHRRGGSAYAHLMDRVAPRLRPEERRDVALYYEALSH